VSINAFLFSRNDVEIKFLHIPGKNYKMEGETIINLYQYTLYNKTNDDLQIKFELKSHKDGSIRILDGPSPVILTKGNVQQGVVEVRIPQDDVHSYKERVVMTAVDREGKELDDYTTSFSAP